jgi:cytochrome c biogenesis protein CcmG/thiol:disulfide interchange protein DsbE
MMTVRSSLLAVGLLIAAEGPQAGAEPPGLASLLTPVDLRGYAPGTKPPPLKGHTLDARELSLTALRGKVVILNFWASWCLECRPEMPMLEKLHRELGPRGLAIVGVNARESKDAVGCYARELGLSFPLVLDPASQINTQYGVVGLPTTFVIARDGRAVAFAVGPREWVSLPARALLEALLSEPAPPRP